MKLMLAVMLAGSVALGAESSHWTYQRPGTAEADGIRHMCLIYHGSKFRVEWTPAAILPYVAHVDEKGERRDYVAYPPEPDPGVRSPARPGPQARFP